MRHAWNGLQALIMLLCVTALVVVFLYIMLGCEPEERLPDEAMVIPAWPDSLELGPVVPHMFFMLHGVESGIYIGFVDGWPRMWGESHVAYMTRTVRVNGKTTLRRFPFNTAVSLKFYTGGIDSLGSGETMIVRRVHI